MRKEVPCAYIKGPIVLIAAEGNAFAMQNQIDRVGTLTRRETPF